MTTTAVGAVIGSVPVPAGATLGITKMRIGMSSLSTPVACHSENYWGEFEDYCVYVGPQVGIEEQRNEIVIYPNPVLDQLFVQSVSPILGYRMISQDGRIVRSAMNHPQTIYTGDLAPGLYVVQFDLADRRLVYKLIKE
jgi:hypothetical protein